MVRDLQAAGHHPIDFGVGDPTEPTPEIIRRAVQTAVDTRAQSGYPSYVGSPEYRQAIADFMDRRFSVKLNVATEICATIGSKEAVFQFPNCLIDPGDIVLCPSPGYPPYN
jgi:LL-diaminopimelate aminotransferase